jgi:uncharacterized protein YfeS
MDYSKRICQGLCQQADSLGLCMGICASSPEFAQSCYDNFKENCHKQGKPFTPIDGFEKPKQEQEVIRDKPSRSM